MIKNIFFDLGGVLFNLNTREAFRKFHEFGMPVPQSILDHNHPINGAEDGNEILRLIHRLDTGDISGNEFISFIQEQCRPGTTREQIIEAYNGMIDVPVERLTLLKSLRKDYKVFLLSNIGDLHWEAACSEAAAKGYPMSECFDYCFCSYQLRVAKPDDEIFRKVIEMSGVNPEESLYIDDSPANIEAGKKAGLISYLIEPNNLEHYVPELFPGY